MVYISANEGTRTFFQSEFYGISGIEEAEALDTLGTDNRAEAQGVYSSGGEISLVKHRSHLKD